MEVRPGYKLTEVGMLPEDWNLTSFGKFLAFTNGVNADKTAYGTGTRFVNVLEPITYSHIYGPEIPGRVEIPTAMASAYAVKLGDVVFNRTSETDTELGLAAVYLGDEHVVFGGFVIRGRPTDDTLDPTYSGYALRAPLIRRQIIPMGQGAIRANIGQQNLRRVLVAVPPKPEQRAIAAALSDVDALLGGLDRLIAKKRDLKQAAMQQLLTGNTRLPGFHGDWQTSTVGREFEIQLGKMLDAERNFGVPKPFIGNKAVQWNFIDVSELASVPMTPSDIQRYRLRKGDLLVCEGGEVGRAAIWEAPIEECYYQKALHRLRPVRGFNSNLMAALLKLWSSRGDLANYVTQTSIAHLPREKFMEVPLPLPSLIEQTAIAGALSDLDTELSVLISRRDKTRVLKQGMMQVLLTGKTRLVPTGAALA